VALASGTRFGPYEISAQIGEGGMGEVYRATDTNLSRQVAIKVLPAAVAEDADRLARFDREARTLAALNHPNIAAIYGVEKGDSTTALVMELVEGPTLADRILQGAIPIGETLRIASQIAEALEAAHEQGIVHRDLKPANIKLRKDGSVKVLDFGLAKTTDAATAASAFASTSPTLTSPALTEAGVILGTAAYMSPEQAKGHPIDRRCDIWAFACVLYEMLTGRRAFPGNSVTETLAAILERDVDWNRLPASTPPGVRTLLRRALTKDPRRRLHHIADARLELDEAHAPPHRMTSGANPMMWPWLASAAVALAAVVVGLWRLTSDVSSSDVTMTARLSIVPEPALSATVEGALAMSPDGRHIAFVAGPQAQLYVRDIDRFEAQALPGTEGADTPAFSPDGKWIAFFANRKIKKIALAGGTPIVLADVDDEARGLGWDSDAWILFNQGRVSGISRAPAVGGGGSQAVTRLQPGENVHRDPVGLPGGTAILYGTTTGTGAQLVFAQSLATGERHLIDRGANPHYLHSGHIAYVQDGSLLVAPFDVDRLEKTGNAMVVLTGVRQTAVGTAQVTFSQAGAIAYVPAGGEGRRDTLVWVDRSGVEEPTLVAGEAFQMPRLAPDLRRVVVGVGASSAQGNRGVLFLYDLGPDTRKSIVPSDGDSTFPVWDPGGRRLVLASGRSDTYQLLLKTLDDSAPDTPITSERSTNYPLSWSPDGRFIATVSIDPNTANDIWVLTADNPREWRRIVGTPSREGAPTFSHDSRLIAYASDKSGRSEIYVQPFPGPGAAVTVSIDGGSEPVFARGAPTLFYRRGDEVIAVDIKTGPPIEVGRDRRVFARAYNRSNGYWPNYDVTPDGRRLLMIRGTAREAPTRVNVVLNWLDAVQ
jgi:serine/threonine-protein kinase